MGIGDKDPGIALAGLRRVDRTIVDDLIGAERANEVDLLGRADRSHVRAACLRDLNRDRPGCALDEHPVAGRERPAVPESEALDGGARALIGFLADREPMPYGRYTHWWAKLTKAAEVHLVGGEP